MHWHQVPLMGVGKQGAGVTKLFRYINTAEQRFHTAMGSKACGMANNT